MPIHWDAATATDSPKLDAPLPDDLKPDINLGQSAKLPSKLDPGVGAVKMITPQTPVTDRMTQTDPAFAALIAKRAAEFKAVEHQVQGGSTDDFFGQTRKAFSKAKDFVDDVMTDVKGNFTSSRDSQEYYDVRSKQIMGLASDADKARAEYMSTQHKPWVGPNSTDGLVEGIPGAVAGLAGAVVGDRNIGELVMAGAVGGSIASVGKGTMAGAGAGFLAGTAVNMAKSSMVNFYDTALKAKTEDGKPMDPEVARGAAIAVGAINGALGVLPLAGVLSKTGLGAKLLGPGAARWLLTGAIGSPAIREVLAKLATNFAVGSGSQAVISQLQELVTVMGEHAVGRMTDPNMYGQKWQQDPANQLGGAHDELARVWQAGRPGLQIGMGIGAFETALHGSSESVAKYDNAGKISGEVLPDNKDMAKKWGDSMQETHGMKSPTFPRASLEVFFKEVGLDGDKLKAAMPEVHRQMEDTKGDPKAEISVSVGDMIGYIAPGKESWKALRNDMRDGSGNFTLNELREKANAKPQEPPADTVPEESSAKEQDIAGRRKATLAAIERLNDEFKAQHKARAETFEKEQQAREDAHDIGKARFSDKQAGLDEEAFDRATASEGPQDNATDQEAQRRRVAAEKNRIEREKQAGEDSATGRDEIDPRERGPENADTRENDSDNTSPYQAPEMEMQETAEEFQARKDAYDKAREVAGRQFKSENARLREEFQDRQDELEEKHDARMKALKDRVSKDAVNYAKKVTSQPLFDKQPSGMPEDKWEKYRKILAEAIDKAQNDIEREILTHLSKEGVDAFEKEKVAVRKSLIATDKSHSLVNYLRTGERLDSGPTPMTDSFKMDTGALERMGLGKETLDKLKDFHEEDGMSPGILARVFGYKDAFTMVQALRDYVPLDKATDRVAAENMPGWTDPAGWLQHRAVAKFTGDVIPKTLWAEFKAIGGKSGQGGAGNYELIRAKANFDIRNTPVSQLDPGKFLQEYHRLGESVIQALDAQSKPADPNVKTLDPRDVQYRRMVAFESWKMARQALEDSSKVNSLLGMMREDAPLRQRVSDLPNGQDHIAALDGAAAAYGYFKPDAPLEMPIGKWVDKQIDRGATIVEDPDLQHRTEAMAPVGSLTVGELKHAKDFLESMYHYLTQDFDKFKGEDGKASSAKDLVASLSDGIRDSYSKAKAKGSSILRGMVAALTTPEHIVRLLDNNVIHGDLAKVTIDPIEAGEARGDTMQRAHDAVMLAATKEINDGSLSGDSHLVIDDSDNNQRLLSKTELLAAFINYGSALNRKALLGSYGITHDSLMNAFAQDLSVRHVEFANKYWAEHEKYFPEVRDAYAQRSGLTLESVTAIPFKFMAADGPVTATGGYVPIRLAEDVRNMRALQSKAGPILSVMSDFDIQDSMTKERQGSLGPVDLDLGRVLSSVTQKIHYATMAEPIAQVSKIVLDPDFRAAVKATLGPEFHDQLVKWLGDKARDGNPLAPLGAWDKAYRWLLSGVSQADVGFNHFTAGKQLPFALSQATTKVGIGHMSMAIANTMRDWKGTWANALEESGVLRRMNSDPSLMGQLTPFDPTVSVGISDKLQQIGHGQIFRTASDVRAYMSELGMAHQNNIRQIGAVFAYEAAKLDAIKQNRSDVIPYAEAVVRQTIGGGDASSFMREPGMARGTVMLYSHMSLIASEILAQSTRLAVGGINKPALLGLTASLLGFLAIPGLSAAAISGDLNSKDLPDPTQNPGEYLSKMIRWNILGHGLGRMTPLIGGTIEQMFAYDKPMNRVAGGPLGQVEGNVRSLIQSVANPKKNLADAMAALATVASVFAKTSTKGIYKDMDLLEGILSGRYGQDPSTWFTVASHGAKKAGFHQ